MVKEYFYKSNNFEFEVEIGRLAKQADGACLVKAGESAVLVTAVGSDEPRDGIGFFPLTCEYQEKMYAVGRIPGGYIKREGRPSDEATLNARMIDRPIRPLFPDNYRNDVQVVASVFSADQDNDTGLLSMIGSSIALSISKIPFKGPIGAVSVGMIDGKYIINPSEKEKENSKLDLIVAGTKEAIMMVEAGSDKISESEMLEAILFAHDEIKLICEFIDKIVDDIGVEKLVFDEVETNQELEEEVKSFLGNKLIESLKTPDKMERESNLKKLKDDLLEHFTSEEDEDYKEKKSDLIKIFEDLEKYEVRRLITEEHIRPDGRKLDQVRQLDSIVGYLPKVHGSGLFTRGQTQVLTVATLGSPGDVQYIDGLTDEEVKKRYIHHYNFPPFSVGDTRPMRGPGRREIGHGRLAERALEPVLPSEDDFPYVVRLVSEVLESNGSSSMASVCGSTLALMDAGVPIEEPVAGIAMGLIKENGKIAILSDIQGLEDHLGDMDFKVAGTKDGITALQMDIKIDGIEREIMGEALERAKKARLHILENMTATIDKPREELSPNAPRLFTLKIDPDKVREVIGSGGKTINSIIDKTGVKIDIEDDGHITVSAADQESGEEAVKIIEGIVMEPEVGDIFLGKIVRIMNFGAFAEFAYGKEGLIHISQIDHSRVNKVEDVLNVGDEVMVKIIEVDSRGRINLSRKALLPKNEDK